MENIIQILADKENQPHQYVGKPQELLSEIRAALTAPQPEAVTVEEIMREISAGHFQWQKDEINYLEQAVRAISEKYIIIKKD